MLAQEWIAHLDIVLAYGHRDWPTASVTHPACQRTRQTSGRTAGQGETMPPLQGMLCIACDKWWGRNNKSSKKIHTPYRYALNSL